MLKKPATMTTTASRAINSSPEYQDGLALRFKLDRGTGLALRSVAIENGIPKLSFSTSHKVPSICEEDVALCIHLAKAHKRPHFFYKDWFDVHPFSVLGRMFKQYEPSYLKGTSVGELLAEADWQMKCLTSGVRCNKNKESFRSWPESSQLEGLETREKFPVDGHGPVMMTCESVDVSESENELIFVGEPKMKITDNRSSSYTSYLTENFDSIAYHDEPSFLKVKEIIKLMLAAEWLRDKGVQFSDEWLKQHTEKPESVLREPVKIHISNEEKNQLLEPIQKQVDSAVKKLRPVFEVENHSSEVDMKRPSMPLKAADMKVSESGVEFTLETTHAEPVFKALTGLYVPVLLKLEARFTVDDFDFLYKGLDPNQPITLDVDANEEELKIVTPDVSSWSELYTETMPIPCKMVEDLETGKTSIVTGGCTTSNFTVRKTAPPTTPPNKTAHVTASKARKAQKVSPTRSSECHCPPPKDIRRPRTEESMAIEKKDSCELVGWKDSGSCSVATSEGTPAKQHPSMHGFVKVTQLIGGKEFGPSIGLYMHLRSPGQEKITQLIGGKEVGPPIMADMHLRNDPKAIDCKTESESTRDRAHSSMLMAN